MRKEDVEKLVEKITLTDLMKLETIAHVLTMNTAVVELEAENGGEPLRLKRIILTHSDFCASCDRKLLFG